MLRLTIEKVLNNAHGLSHLTSGKAVMIPYTLDGDEVEVEVEKETSSYAVATLKNVVSPSVFRTEPICKYYTVCGGCDMLHISREHELTLKEEWVKNDFKRAFKSDEINIENIVFGKDQKYRSKVRYSLDGDALGFKKRKSSEVVNIENCPLVSDETITNVVCVGGKTFHLEENVFFQNNIEIAERLAYFVRDNVVGSVVYDFYSGVGFFSSFLESDHIVTAVEGNPTCKKFAKQNLKNAHFIESSIEDVTKFLKKTPDTIIIDPPRSGLSKKAIKNVLSYNAKRVIYISCSYVNAIRDIKEMKEYSILRVVPFDMFPKTHHVEVAVVLET